MFSSRAFTKDSSALKILSATELLKPVPSKFLLPPRCPGAVFGVRMNFAQHK